MCDSVKASRQPRAPPDPLLVPHYPWHTVGLDFVTNLPMVKGCDSVLVTVIDHLTRDTTTKQTAELFVKAVIRLHGVPQVLVSDRDPLFTAELWASLWQLLGTKLNMSTPRRPQTDGLSERSNETMQKILRFYACEADDQLVDTLPIVEFRFNNAFKEFFQRISPFEAMYIVFKPMTPLDVMVLPYTQILEADAEKLVNLLKDTHAYASELLRLAKDRMAHSYREPIEFVPGDFVYLSTKNLRTRQQSNKK